MNEFVKAELKKLNRDFTETVGEPFTYFFCPLLFRDEDTELCQAHIINEAFADSTRECTVQRADIDNFYGSRFEADFVDIARFKNTTPLAILADPALSKRFNATILLNSNPVEHFYPTSKVPEKFSLVRVGDSDPSSPFGLKMQASDIIAAADNKWEIEVSRDLRLPMLVSTIKAAHLSLFKMLGYPYTFSTSGYFIGRMLLGEFFLQNCNVRKRDISGKALKFFRACAHMVRPVISTTFGAQGTVVDRMMFMCMGGSGTAWAFIVLVKAGEQMHGVMIPTFQNVDQIDTFLGFLGNSNSSIQVATCCFEGDKWKVSQGTLPMTWPKDGVLLL
jgi:hypothetical protein